MDLPEGVTRTVSRNQSKTLRLNPSQNPPQKEFPGPILSSGLKIFAGIHGKGETPQRDQAVQDFDSVEEYHSA